MPMVPFLFIAGVVFAYYMVLPNAIDFLQNFNDDNFDILLQAKDYYQFSILVLAAMGLCFQVPVGILALTRLGIVTVAQLRTRAATHPRDRGRGDAAAGPGPGHDAVADGARSTCSSRALSCLLRCSIDARAQEERHFARPTLKTDRMLFDLRGAGRRRTVKAVYITLAFLMGGGLVLFGIGGGGGVSGGLVDAITEQQRRRRRRRRPLPQAGEGGARQDPGQPAGRAPPGPPSPARASSSRAPAQLRPRKGTFTDAGTAKLTAAGDAWEKLPRAGPTKPDDRVASLMVQAFGALNKPDKAAEAQEVITDARPTASTFTQLAIFAYQAGQTRKGDLAKDKALELTDPDMREALKGQLEQAKQSRGQLRPPPRTPARPPSFVSTLRTAPL